MRRSYIVLGVGLVIAASLAIALALSARPHPSASVSIVTNQSVCIAHFNTFKCSLVVASNQGPLSATSISSARINDTVAHMTVNPGPNGTLIVDAGINITTLAGGLQDVNNMPPVTSGFVVIYLTDGTTVSATLPGEYQE